MTGRVLIIAGSDSGGGAGIQADLKTVTALGGYGATAITALTVQDTKDVHAIHEVPPAIVRQQIEVVLADIGADAIKTGMLHRIEVVEAVIAGLAGAEGIPLVVDPVMVAKGGATLLDPDTIEILRTKFLPLATVLTPNLPEAALLAGMEVGDDAATIAVGRRLLDYGPQAVLMKGGHRDGPELRDILVTREAEPLVFAGPRIDTRHTHGTGCTLASAIATRLAQGAAMGEAVEDAREYVFEAIRTAPGYGAGHGPLNHGHTVRR
ncbi:MAG: bifunctional hydroxymethylpyrimidine kinase/phosphomethylpyrimidine kinase [Alphaproteobacteria bacterium]